MKKKSGSKTDYWDVFGAYSCGAMRGLFPYTIYTDLGPRPASLMNPKALRLEITGWSKQIGFFTGKVAMKHEEFSRFTHDRNESLLCFLQLPRTNF